ncbi:MAG: tryptophan-rich sensory protein [Acidobacteriaceae bacterium]|jgi:tryptophan-rich sensory protein|nr:tryptophan-rich sensory protein [Acidobacteriaceae bacterium]
MPRSRSPPGLATLYLLMGLATRFVWEKPPSLRRRGPMIFWLQLAWNTLRSFLFFG